MWLVHPSIVGVSSWSPAQTSAGRPPPDTLWSLRSESRGTPRARRRLTAHFGCGLIALLIPGLLTRERRGTSSVRFSHPFLQVTPPSTLHVIRGESPTPRPEIGSRPQRFRRVRTLAPMQGRIVVPPRVSRPGHFDAALAGRPWLPPPPEGEFEPRLLYGGEPAQGGFGSHEPHRLRLDVKTLRLTPTPGVRRGRQRKRRRSGRCRASPAALCSAGQPLTRPW
jgi:hypothetical protein